MFVPVMDSQGKPLMPTTPARARKWLKSSKATAFWKGGLFCVRLNVEPSARENAAHCRRHRSWQQARRVQCHLGGAYLSQYSGSGQGGRQGSRDGQYPDAPHAPGQKDSLSSATPEPQAEQKEAPTIYQGALAVETADCDGSLPPLSGECLCRRGYSGRNAQRERGQVEQQFLSAGSRQTLVLQCPAQTRTREHQTGMGNGGIARSIGVQEDG